MAADNKTEQATPRRRQKAREKGQIARSRELSSSLACAAALLVVAWQAPAVMRHWQSLLRASLQISSQGELHANALTRWVMVPWIYWTAGPLSVAFVLGAASSIAQGGFVFAPTSLAPNVERLSPASRLKQMFSITSVSMLLKSLCPFVVITYLAHQSLARDWSQILNASFLGVSAVTQLLFGKVYELAWKSTLVLLLWSALDYLLVRQKLERDLRMSREEIREEAKESEGNPQMKARIRRMQRQVRRRRMLQDVQRATVVVTNPTHFAIALEYQLHMAAPVVVAKGRNLLAQQIKQVAMWHAIPMVENPPLAHALYRAVEVGAAIPAKLYAAVAEILAFVYRAQQQTMRGGARR